MDGRRCGAVGDRSVTTMGLGDDIGMMEARQMLTPRVFPVNSFNQTIMLSQQQFYTE